MYAYGEGVITVFSSITEEEKKKVFNAADECGFELYLKEYSAIRHTVGEENDTEEYYFDIQFWRADSYNDETTLTFLNTISSMFTDLTGNIEYTDDDRQFWRFIYKNGEWVEQEGRIVYDD